MDIILSLLCTPGYRLIDGRLERCVEAGNIPGARTALQRGARVYNISSYTLRNVGYKMAHFLIEEGGLSYLKIKWDLWPAIVRHDLELQLERGAAPSVQDSQFFLLRMCYRHHQPRIFLSACDDSGRTPLMRAIHYDCDSWVVKFLVQSGAEVDARDKSGNTALGIAISKGRRNEAMLLLKHGADIDQQNNAGMTPLMKAVNFYDMFSDDDPIPDLEYIQRRAYILADLLVENGAMIDIQNINKRTALMLACMNQDANTVRLLLSHGASVNLQDTNWRSALMFASEVGDQKSVRLLLECGAEIDMLDTKGYTALMLACMNKHDSVADILVEYKADTSLKSHEGKTVFDIAAEVNSTFVFQQDRAQF